jgi:hypothetical protein
MKRAAVAGARKQNVAVHLRRGSLVLVAHDRTSAGFWTMNEHLEIHDEAVGDATLGAAVRRAAATSRSNVPAAPSRHDSPAYRAFLEAMHARTYGQAMKETKYVGVGFFDAFIRIEPHQNRGSRRGFVPMLDAVSDLAVDVSDNELGAAVRAGLERAGEA